MGGKRRRAEYHLHKGGGQGNTTRGSMKGREVAITFNTKGAR